VIPRAPSRLQKYPELVVIGVLAVALLLFVDLPKTDLWIVALVYDERAGEWPFASLLFFDALNRHFENVFVIAGASASLACILAYRLGFSSPQWQRVGVFLLLSLAVGPGLDTVQFGGTQEFRRITNPGAGGAPERGGAGRSFPSGHAAAAFWSTSLFFVARYLWPQRALLTLGVTVGIGLLVGTGRILAGRHYPSDVLWAGVIVFSISGLIAYLWLKLPRWRAHASETP
jgi:membrane-associated PAP2 superfamily phosphatase